MTTNNRNVNVYVNGPKVVTRRTRPVKVVYIVETHEHCERVIQACSLTWGGKYHCIVPYNKEYSITDEWLSVIKIYGPDKIVTCTKLDGETINRILKICELDRIGHSQDEPRIPLWDPEGSDSPILGKSMYAVLANLKIQSGERNLRPAINPIIDTNNPYKLYIEAKFGFLNEKWARNILISEELRESLTIGDLTDIKHIQIDNNILDHIIRYNNILEKGLPIIDYTLTGLSLYVQPNAWPFNEGSDFRVTNNLLIISSDSCIEDFCWYWNLRVQRNPFQRDLPLWLPEHLVHENISAIKHLFQYEKGYLLSKSLNMETLEKIAKEIGANVSAEQYDLSRFYAQESGIGIVTRQEVIFEEGKARIHNPAPDEVRNTRYPAYYYVDIELPDYKLPTLNTGKWGKWLYYSYRVTKNGLCFGIINQADEYIQVELPTPWQMLQTFAYQAGYDVEMSDKGKLAEKLVDLVDGMQNIWILSGRNVYNLLGNLSEIRQVYEFKQRLKKICTVANSNVFGENNFEERVLQELSRDRHDRALQDFGTMRSTLSMGQKCETSFISWLITKKMIFRGTEIQCPICATKQWLSIDEISSTVRCHGCQQNTDIPLSVDTTHWSYQLNTLCARAYEQGVLPHLFVLNHYHSRPINRPHSQADGLFPGIKLTSKKDMVPPILGIEIDVAWIEDGYLVISECKTHGKEFSLKDVERYIDIARLLACDSIYFCSLDGFSEVDAATMEAIDNARISCVSGDQLFDQYPGRGIHREDDDKFTHSDRYKHALSSYLCHLSD